MEKSNQTERKSTCLRPFGVPVSSGEGGGVPLPIQEPLPPKATDTAKLSDVFKSFQNAPAETNFQKASRSGDPAMGTHSSAFKRCPRHPGQL